MAGNGHACSLPACSSPSESPGERASSSIMQTQEVDFLEAVLYNTLDIIKLMATGVHTDGVRDGTEKHKRGATYTYLCITIHSSECTRKTPVCLLN